MGHTTAPSGWAGDRGQLYGGRMNQQRKEEVKSVTVEAMSKIHESLETMPDEGDEVNQPVINLFPSLSEKRVLFISTCMRLYKCT